MNMIRHEHLKLDRAKRLLRANTEQEMIERALDLGIGEEPILLAHRVARAERGFEEALR